MAQTHDTKQDPDHAEPTATAAKAKAPSGPKGVQMLEGLAHHGLKHEQLVERIAELIVDFPADRTAMAHYVSSHPALGHSMWKSAEHAVKSKHFDDADKHDVKISKYNHGADVDHFKPKDGEPTGKEDPNRMTDSGTLAKIATPTKVYDNMGGSHADAAPGDIQINTGAVSHVLIGGEKVECVYGFKIGGKAMGWVPVSALDLVTQASLVPKAEALAAAVEGQQTADIEFSSHAQLVEPKPLPAAYDNLRTMANQGKLDENGKENGENEAAHYFMRDDQAVNLLFNVPGAGGGRVGVASDRVAKGAQFFKAKNIPPMHTPLYKVREANPTGHKLTFVYGKVVNSAGEAQYGWITEQQLGAEHAAKPKKRT